MKIDKISQGKGSNRKVIKITLVAVIVIFLASFLLILFGINPIVKAYTFVNNVLNNYNSEQLSIEVKSKEFDNGSSGHYKMINRADWIDQNKVKVSSTINTISSNEKAVNDVILMIDNSSISENNICMDDNKRIVKQFAHDVIAGGGNVAVITFGEEAQTVLNFTNNYNDLNSIDNITCNNALVNSYYKAFKNASHLINDYNENNTVLTIDIIADSMPTKDTPNDQIIYNYLKENARVKVNTIQLNDNKNINSYLYKVSDEVYTTNNSEFRDTLYKTVENREFYKEFTIEQRINNSFFDINKDSLITNYGDIEALEDEEGNYIKITIPDNTLRTGNDIVISYTLDIKSEMLGNSGFIPVTDELILNATLRDDTVVGGKYKETPVLQSGYKLVYNPNLPEGCKSNFKIEEKYYAFEKVNITEEVPTCKGYRFRGWNSNSNINYINSNTFYMTNQDVELVGEWERVSLTSTIE